jgi:branched-subunit amino acid transport protein
MTLLLLISLAAITYGSRAAALAFLPRPPRALEVRLDRIPAPLFAGLAALSVIGPDRSPAPAPVVCAAAGALLLAPRRSLLLALAGGTIGYVVGLALS